MNARAVPAPERVEAALRRWLAEHGLASYDPYDGLACGRPWSLVRRRRLPARLWTQAVKNSPFNLRPLVGIRPRLAAKSLADLASAALLRARFGDDPTARGTARELLGALAALALPGRSGACWGLPTPYVTRYIDAAADEPNLFWTACAATSFLDAYELEGGSADLELARSSVDFIRRDLGCEDEGQGGVWFRYFAGHDAVVYNVAALTGALLQRLARHTGEADLARLGRAALGLVARGQNPDGSWYYARGPEGRWIDGFHTGYVLESLLQSTLLEPDAELEAALRRGVEFYRDRMFTPGHLPRYTAARSHPVEVQNCAQAIQTWAKLSWLTPEALARAQAVARAVTARLFRFTRRPADGAAGGTSAAAPGATGDDEAGYFVLSRGRWFTNRLPAVRWGQAPMLLAFTYLLAAGRSVRPSWESRPGTPLPKR